MLRDAARRPRVMEYPGRGFRETALGVKSTRRFVPEQGRSDPSASVLLEHTHRQLVARALLHAAGDIDAQTEHAGWDGLPG